MHIYASVPDAFENCFTSKTFSFIHLKEHPLSEFFFPSEIYTVFYSDSATFEALIHNHAYLVKPNSVLIIRPFEYAHIFPNNTQTINGSLLFVHPDYLKNLLEYHSYWEDCIMSKDRDFLHLRIPQTKTVTSFRHFSTRLHDTAEFDSNLYLHHACLEFLLSLCQCFDNTSHENIDPEQFYTTYHISGLSLEDILSFIDANFTKELTIQFFSKALFVTGTYLCRFFKSHTGITINHYINARRISLAQTYLASGYNITESLSKCGFREYSTFLKTFKKHARCTPTDFLLRNRLL